MEQLAILIKFGIYACMACGGAAALAAAASRSAVRSCLWAAATVVCAAVVLIAAGAELAAMALALLHAGGLTALTLRSAAAADRVGAPAERHRRQRQYAASAAVLFAAALLIRPVACAGWPPVSGMSRLSAVEVGRALMTKQLFPFEMAGLLLFAAMMAARVINRRNRP